MGQTIIKVVQLLQALREQRAEDVERASERGQNHTGRAFHPLALQDPRGRASAGETRGESPLVRAAVVPRREGTRLGAGGEEEGGELGRAGAIVVFPTKTSTTRSFALSSSRLVVSKESKTKTKLERRVQGDGRARRACRRAWAVPTQATCGLPLLKLCSSRFRTSHAKNLVMCLCAHSSIRVSTIHIFAKCAAAKSVFYSADQKSPLCPPGVTNLGRLQS